MLPIRLRHALRFVLLLSGCGCCSSLSALPPANAAAVDPAYNNLGYDQVSARVPRELAPIASVAMARVSIAMHHARQRAEQNLCAGQWTPQGEILLEIGPVVVQSQIQDGTGGSWAYQSFRHPEALSCGDISRPDFFRELSRHLPDWILVRPGGQTTAYRQGSPAAAN